MTWFQEPKLNRCIRVLLGPHLLGGLTPPFSPLLMPSGVRVVQGDDSFQCYVALSLRLGVASTCPIFCFHKEGELSSVSSTALSSLAGTESFYRNRQPVHAQWGLCTSWEIALVSRVDSQRWSRMLSVVGNVHQPAAGSTQPPICKDWPAPVMSHTLSRSATADNTKLPYAEREHSII